MKKVLLVWLTSLLFFISAQGANYYNFYPDYYFTRDNRFYAKAFGGANFLDRKDRDDVGLRFDTGFIVSGSLGYYWIHGLRLEAEYAYRRNCARRISFFGRSYPLSGHFQTFSYMGNLLWDVPLCDWGVELWGIKPFVGGGIGYDAHQGHGRRIGVNVKWHRNGFAWQVMAGLGYPIYTNLDVSLEYKFHKGDLKNFYNHSVGMGLTYNFNL